MTSIFIHGAAPSTASWEQARQAVRSDLWRASSQGLADDVIDRALHAALRRLEAERRWSWLENVEGTLEAQQDGNELDKPIGLRSVVSLAYLSGTRGYDVVAVAPLPMVRASARSARKGMPQAYALFDTKIILDCPVATGDQFEIIFKGGTPIDLAVAVANPPFTLVREMQIVVADACRHLALTRLKNREEAGRHEDAYQFRLQTLFDEEDEGRGDLGGGSIVPDTFMNQAVRGAKYA